MKREQARPSRMITSGLFLKAISFCAQSASLVEFQS